jgi:hypothetical protein
LGASGCRRRRGVFLDPGSARRMIPPGDHEAQENAGQAAPTKPQPALATGRRAARARARARRASAVQGLGRRPCHVPGAFQAREQEDPAPGVPACLTSWSTASRGRSSTTVSSSAKSSGGIPQCGHVRGDSSAPASNSSIDTSVSRDAVREARRDGAPGGQGRHERLPAADAVAQQAERGAQDVNHASASGCGRAPATRRRAPATPGRT